jgi:hypothetical protein
MNDHSAFRAGAVGGTMVSFLGAIAWAEIERTIILGFIGTIVSFLVSFFLKKLLEKDTGKSKSEFNHQ